LRLRRVPIDQKMKAKGRASMISTQGYFSWLEARLAAARATPPDILLVVIAGLGLLIVVIVLAWRRSAQRASSATRKLVELETELVAVRATLDAEVRWRTAAEKWERNQNAASEIKPVVKGR